MLWSMQAGRSQLLFKAGCTDQVYSRRTLFAREWRADLAVPGAEGLDGTAEHDDLLEPFWVWHNAVKAAHFGPPALLAVFQ